MMTIRNITLPVMLFAACMVTHGQATINTVAGSATCCNSADGGQATKTWIPSTAGMTLDRQGNLYIWDAQSAKIRLVNPAGVITTVAGNGTPGYTGDGGPAISAEIFASGSISGLAVDQAGNLYISDGQNHVVRKVNTSGVISTVAGNGTAGFSGDGGLATSAQLFYPAGIAVDSAGNLYIADSSNNRVRKVNAAGVITTVAGNGNVAYSGDGVQATTTAVDRPEGVTVDSSGNLYISETSQARVRKVNASGIISTVAGQTKKTIGFSGDGGPAIAATLSGPIGLAVDSSGNLFIADSGNSRVRKVDAAGIITTFAGIDGNASTPIGDGGPPTSAFLGVVKDVAFDAAGNLYIAGSAGGVARVRKVSASSAFSITPASLAFSYTIGGPAPVAQTVAVSTSADPVSFTTTASTTSGANWLKVSQSSGATPANLTVSIDPAGLPGGTYQGAVTATATGSGASQSFAVTLTVTGADAPAIRAGSVYNAVSYQPKLAPGTVFVIFGTNLGPASIVIASSTDYPTNVGGTSVTFTPATGGAAIQAKMLYSLAGQVAGLLPSSAPPGTYAVRVTYNGLTSAPEDVTVVERSFGIATANSAGSGTAQATIANVNGGLSLTRFTSGSTAFGGYNWMLEPAHPKDTIVLWGTGGGADAANDAGGTSGDQTHAGNFIVMIAGRSITPVYAGASAPYPGLWQINVVLPDDIALGCFQPVQVSAGGELSNTVTVPIAAAGQNACSDPQLSADNLATLDAGGTIAIGGFGISKGTSTTSLITTPGGTPTVTTASQETIAGGFSVYTAAEYAAVFGGITIDACKITDVTSTAAANPARPDGYLDAGALIPVSGPGIASGAAMSIVSTNPGPVYNLVLQNGTIPGGGKYTVTGNGGTGVGAFTAAVNYPASFSVTNWSALGTIDRSKPLTINWTGAGFDQVFIIGSTYSVVGKDAANANILHTVAFTCQVPAAPGSYTIPVAVLSHLLPESIDVTSAAKGSGVLAVEAANTQTFTAPLIKGGQVAFAGLSATLGYSQNLIVQ